MNAPLSPPPPTPATTITSGLRRGDWLALLGVAIFAGTYPATRIAMLGGVTPWQNAAWRAAGAGLVALAVLRLLGIRLAWHEAPRLLVMAGCVGLIFPTGIALALQHVPASHAAILAAALPLATVGYARMRGFDHPARRFWIAGIVAAVLVAAFAWRHGHGSGSQETQGGSLSAYGLLVLAFAAAGVGYVEGAQATKLRPGWQVISWGLVLWLPLSLPVSAWLALDVATPLSAITPAAWAAVLYGMLASMYLGFFPWYAAMEQVGIARVSQWQYLQPFVAIAYGVALLDERIDLLDAALAIAVIATIAWGRRQRRQ